MEKKECDLKKGKASRHVRVLNHDATGRTFVGYRRYDVWREFKSANSERSTTRLSSSALKDSVEVFVSKGQTGEDRKIERFNFIGGLRLVAVKRRKFHRVNFPRRFVTVWELAVSGEIRKHTYPRLPGWEEEIAGNVYTCGACQSVLYGAARRGTPPLNWLQGRRTRYGWSCSVKTTLQRKKLI